MRRQSRAVVVLLTTTALMLCAYKEPPQIAEEIIEPIEIEEEELPLADLVDPYLYEDAWTPEEPTNAVKMRVTCYTSPQDAITASGEPVRDGACAAKREWIGKTAVVYTLDGDYVGKWEITDTGGHPRITEGRSIDLWKPSLEKCYEHISVYGDYMLVEIR